MSPGPADRRLAPQIPARAIRATRLAAGQTYQRRLPGWRVGVVSVECGKAMLVISLPFRAQKEKRPPGDTYSTPGVPFSAFPRKSESRRNLPRPREAAGVAWRGR